MPEVEPCAGGVCSRSVSAGDGGGTPPSQYFGGLGGEPPDPGSHKAIDPKVGISEAIAENNP
jgi:hypothetical protein